MTRLLLGLWDQGLFFFTFCLEVGDTIIDFAERNVYANTADHIPFLLMSTEYFFLAEV